MFLLRLFCFFLKTNNFPLTDTMLPLILPVPFIRQRNDGDCLVACAAMVLGYMGITVAYNRVAAILQTKPGLGTPAYHVKQLVQLGVNVLYARGTLEAIQTHLEQGFPVIAFVQTKELPYWAADTSHAVVVVGRAEAQLYLNDPAMDIAPIGVGRGDFDLAWLERYELYAVVSRLMD